MIHNFSPDTVSLIKRTAGNGLSEDELDLFLYTCSRTGLDPLARQIYAIKRGNKMSIQTAIDGYRAVADRTGKLAGISDPLFDSEEGKYPNKATVTVKKLLDGGVLGEFTATARWSEYNAGGPMWAKMAFLMLGKCAEALALRKAFPADLSGVYTAEEMAQADNGQQEADVRAEVERQKSQHSRPAPETLVDVLLPPELDWSYQKTTGVLLCRVLSVSSRKRKTGGGEYLTIGVNGQVGGKKGDVLTYFHATHRDELLASVGKVVKLETEVKGDFANILNVLEIAGEKVEPAPEVDYETQARMVASLLEFDEAELDELHGRWCKGSWAETLIKLQEEKNRREAISE